MELASAEAVRPSGANHRHFLWRQLVKGIPTGRGHHVLIFQIVVTESIPEHWLDRDDHSGLQDGVVVGMDREIASIVDAVAVSSGHGTLEVVSIRYPNQRGVDVGTEISGLNLLGHGPVALPGNSIGVPNDRRRLAEIPDPVDVAGVAEVARATRAAANLVARLVLPVGRDVVVKVVITPRLVADVPVASWAIGIVDSKLRREVGAQDSQEFALGQARAEDW